MSSMAWMASCSVKHMITPFPAHSPDAFTTIGAPAHTSPLSGPNTLLASPLRCFPFELPSLVLCCFAALLGRNSSGAAHAPLLPHPPSVPQLARLPREKRRR
eukprot:1246226-Rhodomonas_salina.1